MKKLIVSLALSLSFLPMVSLAKQPTPIPRVVICTVNPLYGTGGYQPYFLCTIN